MRASPSAVTLGTLSAVGGSLAFSLGDMSIKFLSGGYPLHEIVLIRSVIGLAILLGAVIPLAGGYGLLRTRQPGKHLLRGAFVVAANMTFFLALSAMPLANATAIFYVSPLMIALFSILFLGEHVGPRRWAAIAVGLLGAMVMVRPGSDTFSTIALLPLVSAACYAGLNTMTRKLGPGESAATMAFYIQLTFIAFSVVFGLAVGNGRFDPGGDSTLSFLLREWVWPAPADLPFFALAGFGTALGGLMISQAYRLCEAALVAPLEYAALPMAIFWGLTVFGDWPDAVSWIGIALILGAGIYMVLREARPAAR
ncbi:MAG: DMT family transporter [Rhodobacter sp.]|uniref:DMT family transporter n=1 Tax=Pararhodobacter sp. TaxID=2127056 RepID=UPI001DF9A8A0|nr:DMT family transporter [Pararhodobacter sp.]MCB1346959.1 DMT family transporter [Paracoccaceae bacterium]MCC0072383.1 DMT family transporter [Rhodobacter sp.]HPD91482.1 DMT family transporter [Pararhodobacter sp.]